jgi:hypothetical protein
MGTDPFASRLAIRLRRPIVAVGATSAVLAAASLATPSIPDVVVTCAAIPVAIAAAAMFGCATFDMRFQKALSALNAERRAQARRLGWKARLFGIGLPIGDRLFFTLAGILSVVTMAAFLFSDRSPAAALALSAFFLVAVGGIALMVRGYPTDRFFGVFT